MRRGGIGVEIRKARGGGEGEEIGREGGCAREDLARANQPAASRGGVGITDG